MSKRLNLSTLNNETGKIRGIIRLIPFRNENKSLNNIKPTVFNAYFNQNGALFHLSKQNNF